MFKFTIPQKRYLAKWGLHILKLILYKWCFGVLNVLLSFFLLIKAASTGLLTLTPILKNLKCITLEFGCPKDQANSEEYNIQEKDKSLWLNLDCRYIGSGMQTGSTDKEKGCRRLHPREIRTEDAT
jgi:hypothetical protein